MRFKVAFIGGTRYSKPLDETSRKKFRLLAELGDIFVVGFSRNLRPRIFYEYAHFYLLPQWSLPVLRYLTMFTVGPLLALWLIFRYNIQILVTQSPYEGFVGAVTKKIAGLFGRRVALVVENHGDFEKSLFLQRRVKAQKLYRFIMCRVASFSLRYADVLRAISNATRSQLKRWTSGKPIVQFPTWTDIEVFFAAGKEEKIYENKKTSEIVYVGVLTPLKGIHFLIEAFSRIVKSFSEARLVIIGKEENQEYANFLKKQVEELGLSKKVEFLPPMPRGELARRVARACVLVLPSLSEGLGRVVFEAMACGTPVIGSRVGGIPEMIQDGGNGFLVPPGDVDALAERLHWVLEHPDKAKYMGEQAREFAKKFFSPEAYLQGYAKLFNMALSKFKEG